LLLFVSGATRYHLAADKFLIVVFIIALSAWYLFTDRKVSDKFLLYLTIFVGLLFLLSLYTGGSLSVASVLKTTMKFALAYLVIRTVGINFTETFIKVVVLLAAISLFGYMTDIMHLFDGLIAKLPAVGKMGYEGVLYTYRHAWHPERNNSIFFEPGAYQGFLNAALFLVVFANTSFSNKKKWGYVVVLATALITTSSTTGYIIFGVLYVLFLYKSNLATYSQKLMSVGLNVLIITVFAAQFHTVLIEKLDNYINPNEARKGWSSENRSFDAQTDLKIFKNHVFGLGYEKYKKEFVLLGNVSADIEGSSNGVTSMLANYGLPYALFIFVSYFWAIRRMLGDYVLAAAAYLVFIIFLWGESYYQLAPISFCIIAAAFVYGRETVKHGLEDRAGHAQKV